jgi:SAM-dependent methyltransferase
MRNRALPGYPVMAKLGPKSGGSSGKYPLKTLRRLKRMVVHHLARPGHLPRLVWKNLTWPLSPMAAEIRFDRALGIDTAGIIAPEHLDFAPERTKSSAPYQASPARITRHVVRQIASRLPGATFIDVGSGKGRVVIIAAEYGFSKVIGIELSPQLCAIAVENIAKHGSRRPIMAPITMLNMDATEFQIPPCPCVFFFFSPFSEAVMREVVVKLVHSLEQKPRKVFIIYCGIETSKGELESLHGDLFDRNVFNFERLHDLPRDRSARPGFSVVIFESKVGVASLH